MKHEEEPAKTDRPTPTRKLKTDQDILSRFVKQEEEPPKPKPKVEIQGEGIKAAKANVAALFGGPPAPAAHHDESPKAPIKIEADREGISAAKANVASLLGASPAASTSPRPASAALSPSPASPAAAPAAAPAASPAAAPAPAEIPDPDWKSANAPDGRVYYYNVKTKQTAWTMPMIPAPAASPPVEKKPAPAPPTPAAQPEASGVRSPSLLFYFVLALPPSFS